MSHIELEEVDAPAACPGCGGAYPAPLLAQAHESRCHVCGGPNVASTRGPAVVSTGIIMPDGFGRDDDEEENPEGDHPREGFVVAVYLGTQALTDPCEGCGQTHVQQYLIEIVEQYSQRWRITDTPSYHYKPWDLTKGLKLEVKTIGFIHFDPESDEVPGFIDMVFGDPARQRGKPIGWRRIR